MTEPLHEALEKGDVAKAEQLLKEEATTRPESSGANETLRRYMTQMLDDSLVISAAHLHSQVRQDRAFLEQVVRYLSKVARHSYAPSVFHQAFKAGAWLPIEEVPVADPVVERLFRKEAEMATHLVQTKHESIVFIIDYIHTGGPYMNLRLATILSVARRPGAPKERTGKQSEKEFIDAIVANSGLVEQRTTYDAINLAEWSPDAQSFLKAELSALEKARLDLSTDYAVLMYDRDLQDACAAFGLHKIVTDSDKAAEEAARVASGKEAKTRGRLAGAEVLTKGGTEEEAKAAEDAAIKVAQDAAAASAVGPMLCFLITCGATVQTTFTQLSAEELDKLIVASAKAAIEDPLAEVYATARQLMVSRRERGEAVVILQRYADGVVSAYCRVQPNIISFAELGPIVERQMEMRKKLAAQMEERRKEAEKARSEKK